MVNWGDIEDQLRAMELNAPAADADIAAARRELGVDFPGDYIEFLKHADGAVGIVREDHEDEDGGWLWLYSLTQVVEATKDLWAWEEDDFRPLVVLGSDGGAMSYVLDPRPTPPQIYEWELYMMHDDGLDAVALGSTLGDLLAYISKKFTDHRKASE